MITLCVNFYAGLYFSVYWNIYSSMPRSFLNFIKQLQHDHSGLSNRPGLRVVESLQSSNVDMT